MLVQLTNGGPPVTAGLQACNIEHVFGLFKSNGEVRKCLKVIESSRLEAAPPLTLIQWPAGTVYEVTGILGGD